MEIVLKFCKAKWAIKNRTKVVEQLEQQKKQHNFRSSSSGPFRKLNDKKRPDKYLSFNSCSVEILCLST